MFTNSPSTYRNATSGNVGVPRDVARGLVDHLDQFHHHPVGPLGGHFQVLRGRPAGTFGNIQGTFREHLGNIQGTFREHLGNICGGSPSSSEGRPAPYCRNIREHSGTFREHSGNIQGTFREHSGNI
eukprot:1179197-Prorocentrum_minimum.AAC.1